MRISALDGLEEADGGVMAPGRDPLMEREAPGGNELPGLDGASERSQCGGDPEEQHVGGCEEEVAGRVVWTRRGLGQTGRHPLPGMYSRLPGSDLQPLPAAKRAAVTAMRTKRRFMAERIATTGRGLNRIDLGVGWPDVSGSRLVGRDSVEPLLKSQVFRFKVQALVLNLETWDSCNGS